MKVAISSVGDNLDVQVSSVFGRCAYFLVVDTETMDFQAYANSAASASGGAGIQAAQFAVEKGAEAVLTGNVGPNAMGVLQAANVQVYTVWAGTARQAVEAFKGGQLQPVSAATTATNTGRSGTAGPIPPSGAGLGRGMGKGRGGGGRGQGRGGGGAGGGGGFGGGQR
jgi:predicted Fe-Mo cluster-binding NifX family protein